jgi:hypothetical protein
MLGVSREFLAHALQPRHALYYLHFLPEKIGECLIARSAAPHRPDRRTTFDNPVRKAHSRKAPAFAAPEPVTGTGSVSLGGAAYYSQMNESLRTTLLAAAREALLSALPEVCAQRT